MILSINILNNTKFDLDTDVNLTLADYKNVISANTNFNIDSYVIKHQTLGSINWDTKISTLESIPTIYLAHVIRG
jgi:hypothetical protein